MGAQPRSVACIQVALNDLIEVGVFTGKKDEEKPRDVRRERMTQEHTTYTFVVDQQPTRAGIDPYNKLVDRIADDNMMDVTKHQAQAHA